MAANQIDCRQLPITCRGHTRPVLSLDFSDINGSYYYMVSASKDGFPMLRQGDTGDWIGTFHGHKGAIWDVKINNLGTVATTAGADFSAKVWNALNGRQFYSFDHQHVVKSVAFDERSEHLLTAGNEKVLRIFDLCSPYAMPYVYTGHTASVKSALFCRNDKCLVSISDDQTLRLWDTISGQEIQRVQFPTIPSSISISGDKTILTVTEGNAVSFWEADTMNKINEIEMDVEMTAAILHPDKSIFVCGGKDFRVRKYDYQSGQQLESYNGHFGRINTIKFSPDGEIYATGSEDGTLRLWQNSVGKTYGKWGTIQPRNSSFNFGGSGENSNSGSRNSVNGINRNGNSRNGFIGNGDNSNGINGNLNTSNINNGNETNVNGSNGNRNGNRRIRGRGRSQRGGGVVQSASYRNRNRK